MQDTEWTYSNEVAAEEEYVNPVEGPQYLVINGASFDNDTSEYTLSLKSLTNDANIRLKYWLDRSNQETGEIEPDSKSRRVLVSLKKALYGADAIGIPNPVDITGCVVEADVKLKAPNAKGIRYPAIYNYKAVPTSIAEAFGNPEQYSIPDEGDAAQQDLEE